MGAKHCDHECVCGVLMVGGIEGDTSPCDFTGCGHDTRIQKTPLDNWCPYQSKCVIGKDHCDWPCDDWFTWHDHKIIQEEREKKYWLIRNALHTDQSGLADSLAKIREIAQGYRWIPDNEWGNYDYTQRTTETLQKECGYLIDAIEQISYEGLRDSGQRVNRYIKMIEKTMYDDENEEQP